MTHYLISFPSEAMVIPDGELEAIAAAAHAVIQQMKDAGVYVFGGGINEEVPPVMVTGDGNATEGTYPSTRELRGGFTVVKVDSRDEAVAWAAKVAVACRCDQELREFQYDPES